MIDATTTATEKQEGAEKQERLDHDGFWKDLIARFWRELLKRALPDLYADADLSKEARFLDKELRDTLLTPGAEGHHLALFVDELLEIPLKNGDYQWVLLHIEIQGPGGKDISFRMVIYCCLIFSHYRRAPVALAILTSPRPQEKLGVYEASQYGTRLLYQYNCLELYNQDDEELLGSDNPLDLALYAAKKALLCRDEEGQKFHYLLNLTRLLAKKGWSEKDRRDILLFIERVINLKDHNLRRQYVADVKRMGEEQGMAYVSFIEEYFRGEGRIEGMREGISEGRLAEKLATAARMRSLGMAEKDILKVTELSPEDINAACPQ